METIKDIIAEMREHSGEIFPPWVIYNEDGGIDVTLLVNRIEAAHKREAEDVIAATVKAAAESASEVYEPHTKSEQVSNAAKMREALVQCELFLGNVSRHGHPTLNPGDKCTACDGADELRGMVARALSAPPRNYDLYATEAERLDAFIAYYNETFDLKGEYAFDTYDLKHNVDGIFNDYINWLFAEAKGE